jgi:lipopolysaccharide export system permease protein
VSLWGTLLYKMRTLSRYILAQQIAPFLFGIFIILFILILDFLYKNLEVLIGKGVPMLISLELLILSMGWMIVMAVPMAVLIATLISFMRMSSDNEIVAMKTGGMSLVAIARPVLMAGVVLSFAMIPVHNFVVPETNHRLANLLVSIHRKKPALQLRDGVFMNDIKGYSILVNKSTGREIEGVTISKLEEGKPAQTIRAERGEIFFSDDGNTLVLRLYNGEIHDVDEKDPKRYLRLSFNEHTMNIPDAGTQLIRLEREHRGDREMSITDLRAEMKRMQERIDAQDREIVKIVRQSSTELEEFYKAETSVDEKSEGQATRAPTSIVSATEDKLRGMKSQLESHRRRIRSLAVEVHKKIALSFACIVFVIIGVPIGVRAREASAGAGMVISVLFFAVYYAFLKVGENLADRGLMPPTLSMWAANIVLGAIGLHLFMRANRELPIIPPRVRRFRKEEQP